MLEPRRSRPCRDFQLPPLLSCGSIPTISNKSKLLVQKSNVLKTTSFVQSTITTVRKLIRMRLKLFDEAMGEEVHWERHVELDATIIRPNCCSCHCDFLRVLELKNTLGIHGDAHFLAVLDCSKIISLNRVRCLISIAWNSVLPLFCLVQAFPGVL